MYGPALDGTTNSTPERPHASPQASRRTPDSAGWLLWPSSTPRGPGLKSSASRADARRMAARLPRTCAWVLPLLTTISAILAGCGSGRATGSLPSASPQTSVTRAAAVAYARAVNLEDADLPGMTPTTYEGEGPPPTPRQLAYDRCAGTVDPSLRVGKFLSGKFVTPRSRITAGEQWEQIYSNVVVMPTLALAARKFQAEKKPLSLSCVSLFAPAALQETLGRRWRVGQVTVTPLPNPAPGLPGVFAFRTTAALFGARSRNATPRYYYKETFCFLSGPAEVNLLANAYPHPASEATVRRLLLLSTTERTATGCRGFVAGIGGRSSRSSQPPTMGL